MSNTQKLKPVDDGGTFDLDVLIAEQTHEPFEFTFAGRTWSIRHADDLDVWPLIAAAEGGDMAAAMTMLEAAFGEQWADFQAKPMPRGALSALQTRWLAFSGVDSPGE